MLTILNPFLKYITAGLASLVLVLGITARYQSSRIHTWHVRYDQSVADRKADRAIYEAAQKAAAEHNKVQVSKVEQTYQRNSDDAKRSYLSDLARLRADNQRLRQQARPAPGAPDGAGAPPPSPAPGGVDGDGVSLSPDGYLHAQEIELRLMHLQGWVIDQLKVDPNQ